MKRIENECVGCPAGMPCLGDSCPKRHVEHIYCDRCGDEADYRLEDEDLCESCLKTALHEEFDSLSFVEQAEYLCISLIEY